MFDKLLKALSLEEENSVEKTDWKGPLLITLFLFSAVIGIGTVWYQHVRNSKAYRYDDSMTVSENGTRIVYDNDGAYLINGKKVLSDTYAAIEKDPFSDYCRVINKDGLIGFIAKEDGRIVIKPQYTDASPMSNQSSCVSEGNGFYFISENGERMTENYEDAYPWERQGTLARVKNSDGWAVIDRKGTILFDRCESIDSLPVICSAGTAVRDGHVLLLQYSDGSDETASVQLVKEFEEFLEVSQVYNDQFAVVIGKNGFGAIGFNGDIIMPAVYKDLDWDSYKIPDEVFKKEIVFKGKKKNGRLDVMNWNPLKNQ